MNCKPGDLAIVVRTKRTPEMLGRIVTVVRPATHGEIFRTDIGYIGYIRRTGDCSGAWVVSSNNPMPWKGVNGSRHLALERVFGDEFLRPINPGDLVEDENQDNKLKEPA